MHAAKASGFRICLIYIKSEKKRELPSDSSFFFLLIKKRKDVLFCPYKQTKNA